MNQSCIPNPMPQTCMLYAQASDVSPSTGSQVYIDVLPNSQWVMINSTGAIQSGYGISVNSIGGLVSTCGNKGYEVNEEYDIDASQNMSIVSTDIFGNSISVNPGDIVVAEIMDPDGNNIGGMNKVKDASWDISHSGQWDSSLWNGTPAVETGYPAFCCALQDIENGGTNNCSQYVQNNTSQFNQICGLLLDPSTPQFSNCWSVKGWGASLLVLDSSNNPLQTQNLTGGYGIFNTVQQENDAVYQGQANILQSGTLGFRFNLDQSKNYVGKYQIKIKYIGCPASGGVANSFSKKGDILFYIGPEVSDDEKEKNATSLKINNNYTVSTTSNAYVKINTDDQLFYMSRPDGLLQNFLANNLKYKLQVTLNGPQYPISGFISNITNQIRNAINSASQSIYENGTCTGSNSGSNCIAYITIIKLLLVLYITIAGIFFAMGAAEFSQKELVERGLKVGTILALLQQNSWNFFSEYFLNLFIDGTDVLLANSASNIMGSGANKWSFIDNIFAMIFYSPGFIYQLLALIFSSFFGFILFGMVVFSILTLLKAFFGAIKSYIFSVVVIGCMTGLTPIFIIFILFGYTKEIFENWWKTMAKFALEPVLLIASMSILSQMILTIIRKIMSYGVCWNCLIGFKNFPQFCLNFFQIWGIKSGVVGGGFVFEIFGLTISLFIVSKMMEGLLDAIFNIGAQLLSAGGNRENSSLSSSIPFIRGGGFLSTGADVDLGFKSLIGMDKDSVNMRTVRRNQLKSKITDDMFEKLNRPAPPPPPPAPPPPPPGPDDPENRPARGNGPRNGPGPRGDGPDGPDDGGGPRGNRPQRPTDNAPSEAEEALRDNRRRGSIQDGRPDPANPADRTRPAAGPTPETKQDGAKSTSDINNNSVSRDDKGLKPQIAPTTATAAPTGPEVQKDKPAGASTQTKATPDVTDTQQSKGKDKSDNKQTDSGKLDLSKFTNKGEQPRSSLSGDKSQTVSRDGHGTITDDSGSSSGPSVNRGGVPGAKKND